MVIKMSELLSYKCPCCDGAITFDSTTQMMKCPFCDTEFSLETLQGFDEDLKASAEDAFDFAASDGAWAEGETEDLRIYVCQSCGGEIVAQETTGADFCPYCGNSVVMKGSFAGDLRPDFVIPFKLDKNAAKAALKRHMEKKPLLPKAFRSENRIEEIRGVYVPFWVYDAGADADMRYRATRVRTWTSGEYRHIQTSYYSITRAGSIHFEKVPVDGSSKMADDLMESVEPYDFSQAVDFQTAYLSGYLAERYDVSAEDSRPRAESRMKKAAEDAFRRTVSGYNTVTSESGSIRVRDGVRKYVLYPVWILNTTWKNEKYTFAMNGQTGKFVGNLPTDSGLFVRYLLLLTAIFSVCTFAVQWLWNAFGGSL